MPLTVWLAYVKDRERERLWFFFKPLVCFKKVSIPHLQCYIFLGKRSKVYAWLVDFVILSRSDWSFVPQFRFVSGGLKRDSNKLSEGGPLVNFML